MSKLAGCQKEQILLKATDWMQEHIIRGSGGCADGESSSCFWKAY